MSEGEVTSVRRLLGPGQSRLYVKQLRPGEVALEADGNTYAVDEEAFFCPHCDGCGCQTCRFTGERSKCPPRFRRFVREGKGSYEVS